MIYYTYQYDNEGQLETNYLELDEEFYCLRAVTEVNGVLHSTNFIDPESPYFLPEKSLEDFLDELTSMSKQDFLLVWNKALRRYLSFFHELKNRVQVGSRIIGTINCFYPQGVILDLGEKFHGISEYNQCLRKVGSEKMYPGTMISFVVDNYDDENMMLILTVN